MRERLLEIAEWLKTAVPPSDYGLVPGSFFAPGGSAAPWIAVVLPLVVSLVLLYQARSRLHQFSTLIKGWFVSLPLMYFTSYWREVDGVLCLQIVVIFRSSRSTSHGGAHRLRPALPTRCRFFPCFRGPHPCHRVRA